MLREIKKKIPVVKVSKKTKKKLEPEQEEEAKDEFLEFKENTFTKDQLEKIKKISETTGYTDFEIIGTILYLTEYYAEKLNKSKTKSDENFSSYDNILRYLEKLKDPVFDSKPMLKEREKLILNVKISREKIELQSGGIFKCKKCGSDRILVTEMQTRSADEPTTTFFFCTVCNNSWRQG